MDQPSPTLHPRRILLCEEDPVSRSFLDDNLTADGYIVVATDDRDQALARLRGVAPDVILVDANGNTLGLVDAIRTADPGLYAAPSDTPLIVLTSRHEELHRVRILERGADDIVSKPFSYPELRARIAAVLRRTSPRVPPPVLAAGPVHIDLRQRSVTVAGRPVELRALEYQLLCKLASEPTRVFTRNELMRDIWGYTTGHTRTLDSHASRLRAKLVNESHNIVINVWGVGYRLIDIAT
jgi:DNA-binding response OmpR family regulator